MGVVTNYMQKVIQKQIDDHGIVVWYDPERHYAHTIHASMFSNAQVIQYRNSFFALRNEIYPLLDGSEPPKVLIYVPLDPSQSHHALAEVEAVGVVMKPGQQPPFRNTRLSLMARNALKQMLGDETAETIEKQVEDGKLDLADLDALAEQGEGISKGVVAVVFGTTNPQEIALSFLSTDKYDESVNTKQASKELLLLFNAELGANVEHGKSLVDVRTDLARHVLATDFVKTAFQSVPEKYGKVGAASNPSAREACLTLARTWRMRRDTRDSYVLLANRIEKQLGLSSLELSLAQAAPCQTFLNVEVALLAMVEQEVHRRASIDLIDLAKQRQSSFWAETHPELQSRWALLQATAQLLVQADSVETELKNDDLGADKLIARYTSGSDPWCLLDTYHRNMERRYFAFDIGEAHENLEKLIGMARTRYTEVASSVAEKFVRLFRADGFSVAGQMRQVSVFDERVRPLLNSGKTAYVLVDALRYEMARELAGVLASEFESQINHAMASVPTITEVGMASLMPIGGKSVSIIPSGSGKLALQIGDQILKDRKGRIKYLKDTCGFPVFDAKLEELFPRPQKRVRDGVQQAALVLVTSQEIDELCEGDNVPLARRTMHDMLNELRRAFRILTGLGVENIIVAADHGFLFGEDLGTEMLIDSPGGDTKDLHRRVWVGLGGSTNPALLRASLSEFGFKSDLDIATPWNLACFKVAGGAAAYFHGGLSLQELIIPVITLKPKRKAQRRPYGDLQISLTPGSKKISTRFFSVIVEGLSGTFLEVEAPKVRIEVRDKAETISTPISASHGFEDATGEVQLKFSAEESGKLEQNTITVQITKVPETNRVSVHLIDVNGVELAKLESIDISISI